jgi:hypothetical protein
VVFDTLKHLPPNILSGDNMIEFVVSAGEELWWTYPALLSGFCTRLLDAVINSL